MALADVTTILQHGPHVCLSVTLTLMHPVKSAGWNEMPFGRDTCVVPTNIALDRAPDLPREGEIWGQNLFLDFLFLNLKCFTMGMLICKLPLIIIVAQ